MSLLLLLLLLALLPAALFGLLATEGGTAWLLRQASELAPRQGIEFRYGDVRGDLLGRMVIDDLQLGIGDTRVESGQLLLHWRPEALWQRRLHILAFELTRLKLGVPPGEEQEPAALQLPDIRLPLAVQVDRLLVDGAVIEQPGGNIELRRLALSAAADSEQIRVQALQFSIDGASLGGDLTLDSVAPHAVKGRLLVSVDKAVTGDDVGAVALQADIAGEALRPAFDVIVTAPTPLNLTGTAALDQVTPGFDLSASWQSLQWPLVGEPQVSAAQGQLGLVGNADDYRLVLRTRLTLPGQPSFDLALDAHGDTRGMQLQPLVLTLRDGRLQADGRVGWAGQPAWQLQLLAERLDPGLLAPDWPGQIGGRVALEGRLAGAANDLQVSAVIEALQGQLRGYPVSADGALDWRQGRLTAKALRMASGPNKVLLDGRADQQLDLAFDIDAPDLAALYPGLAGTLRGDGRLAGSPASPAVTAKLRGAGITFEDTSVARLSLDVDWRNEGGRAALQADEVKAGETLLSGVSARLDGRIDAHRLSLDLAAADASLSLAAEGGLRDRRWQGVLNRLQATAADLGEWRLQAPAALRLAENEASVERLCLNQAETALCLLGGWSAAAGLDLRGDLNAFDLARLARYLPGEAVIEGQLAARFEATGPLEKPQATFELRPGDGRIRLEEGDEPFDLAFRNALLSGRFKDDVGSADLRFEIGANGRANGRIGVGADKAGQRSLSGKLEADFPDLALVAGFVPALQEVKGRLGLDIDLGGSVAQPQITGGLMIEQASARIPAAGIQLRDVQVALQSRGAERGGFQAPMRVTAQARSGDGNITIDGSVDLQDAAGQAVDLRIRGTNFEAARLPEARVLVAPDLRLQGNGRGAQPYLLSGTVRIPKAAIELKEVPSGTVAVSDDEIIVGQEAPASRTAGSPLATKLRVELGDDVTFKGFGLKTGLTGALDAVSGRQGTIVDGKIELRDASYKAYGQDLTVERGRLLFAGPPGNPDVDLRAVRESRDGLVKAYLAMSGPLAKPRPRVYTEPALPEAEAVAYLLTGRGLDDAGAGEGVDIAGAALSLGLSRSEPLLQDLSDRLGLDDLRIEGGDNGLADSSVLLGKYLNPDLYLGYTQGLFNPEGAVLLRLRLHERLELESRSGNEQSVDLFYKIEHN